MANKSRAIRAARAFVEIFADNSKLIAGLRAARAKLKAFGKSVRAMGLKIVGAVGALTASVGGLSIKAASDAQESLSRFEAVFRDQAKAAGQFADALAHSVGRSKIEIRDALATFQSFFVGLGFSGEAARGLSQTMQSLALDFASFHNLSDDEAIGRFISALSGSSEVLDRFGINIKQAALEQELLAMGVRKSWTEVTEQEKALARLNIIARAMGDQGAIGDAVKTAGSFTNQMKRLRGLLRDTSVSIGQALLPVVAPLVQKAAEMVRQLGEWISRNQQLVAMMFKVAAVVIAGGLALAALGTVIRGLGSALGVLATVMSIVGSVLGALTSVIAFMVSPIGLVIGAVVALGGYILYATGVAGKALAWLGDKFNILKEDALASFGGIADALAAGDIGLAMKILWLTLKMEWTRGVNFLEKAWLNFRNFFIRIGYDAWHGMLAMVETVWHNLEMGWIETTAFFSRIWNGFVNFFAQAWEGMKAMAAKAWAWIKSWFDDSVDLDVVYREIDAQRAAAVAKIDDDQQRKQAERELRRQRERERAQRQHQGTMAEIGRQNLAKHQELDAEYVKRMADNEKELAEARKGWQDAIGTAREKRAAMDRADAGPGTMESPDDILARVNAAMLGLGNMLAEEVEKISAKGTFYAAHAVGLQGGDATDRMVNGIEKIEKNTRSLRNIDELAFT